jgi:hypothetical protein
LPVIQAYDYLQNNHNGSLGLFALRSLLATQQEVEWA